MRLLTIKNLGLNFFVRNNVHIKDVFVHFTEWYNGTDIQEFEKMRERCIQSEQVRILGIDFILNQILLNLLNKFKELELNNVKLIHINIKGKNILLKNIGVEKGNEIIVENINCIVKVKEDKSQQKDSNFLNYAILGGSFLMSLGFGIVFYKNKKKICKLKKDISKYLQKKIVLHLF
jgi:hypothetical protein